MRVLYSMIALAGLALASCKKDRVCECVTQVGDSANKTTSTVTMVDVNLRTASNACIHRKYTIEFPDTSYVVDEYCKLK